MSTAALENLAVLVVEDDYMIAQEIRRSLEDIGAIVVGPAPSVAKALRLIESRPGIDTAVLDVNLGEEDSFPIASALEAKGVPFLFSTGYNSADVPAEWQHVRITTKPLRLTDVADLLHGSGAP